MLPEIVSSLGLGGQVVTAATLFLGAIYVYRAQAVARIAVAVGGTLAGYALVLLIVLAVATGLGWVDPRPATVFEHARAVWSFLSGRGAEWLMEVVRIVATAG
ncbi:hypothetical protein [Haloparvum sedimenti]|uniref:hypothetical protein n=1 Tax=Haloparvum sedimenti TaxID=1678448 RepID=UPI00071E7DAE|nr:hypothetical protein [Haloparvum sedimenti]